MRISKFLFIALFSISAAASAEEALKLDLVNQAFAPQKVAVIKAIGSDEYSEITNEKREVVTKALDNISGLLVEDASFATLDAGQREQVLQYQKLINNELKKAKNDSRIVCSSESKTGSNFPVKVCRTLAAQKRQRAETQAGLEAVSRSVRNNSGKAN